jgi:hypothetical protein
MGGRTSTSWKRGRSANPGGRPKNVVNVQELARSYTEAAIETLAKALADPKLRVQAAVAILDRGWGKPTQPLANDAEQPVFVIRGPPAVSDVGEWLRLHVPPELIDGIAEAAAPSEPPAASISRAGALAIGAGSTDEDDTGTEIRVVWPSC